MILIKIPIKNLDANRLRQINNEAKAIAKEFRLRLFEKNTKTLKRSRSLNTDRDIKIKNDLSIKRSKSLDNNVKRPEKNSEIQLKYFETPKDIKISVKANMDSKSLLQLLLKVQKYFKKDFKAAKIIKRAAGTNCIPAHKFIELVNILLKQIDIHFEVLTISNYINLLPAILKRLFYPRALTVKMIKTVHTTQNWALALQILSWLIDLRNQIEKSRNIIKNNIFSLSSDLSDEKILKFKVKQAEAKTLIATFNKLRKGHQNKKEFDIFIRELKQIYNYKSSELPFLKNYIENVFRDIEKIKSDSQKLPELIEVEQKEYQNLIEEKNKLDEQILSQIKVCNNLKLQISRYTFDKKVPNIPEKKINKVVELYDTKDFDFHHFYVYRKIANKMLVLNLKIQKNGLFFSDLNDYIFKNEMIQNKKLNNDIIKNVLKVKETIKHFTDVLKIDELTIEHLRRAIAKKVENINLIQQRQLYLRDEMKMVIFLTKPFTTEKVDDVERKIRQISCIITEMCFLKAQKPDIPKLKAEVAEKQIYFQALKKGYQKKMHDILSTFENLEHEISKKVIPGYKDKRNKIMQTIKIAHVQNLGKNKPK